MSVCPGAFATAVGPLIKINTTFGLCKWEDVGVYLHLEREVRSDDRWFIETHVRTYLLRAADF